MKLVAALARSLQADMQVELRNIERAVAAGGTPVDLEFAYTLSAQSKLVLTAHEVYLPKPKLAVEGPGGVQASFDFRGAKNTAAGRMLTVTLTNDLDGLVYG